MFKNIYKIVLRNMWRYKGYTLLNIFGMGVGLAAIVWGFQTYRFSMGFDDPYYFSKRFTTIIGMSPKKYRTRRIDEAKADMQ